VPHRVEAPRRFVRGARAGRAMARDGGHMPIVGDWICESCFGAASEEARREWRMRYAIPSRPDSICSQCCRLPPLNSMLASLARLLHAPGLHALGPSRRAATDVPRRRAYPLREAAQLVGVSLTKMKDEIRDGRISTVTAGKRRRVLDAEITRYLLANGARRRV